MLWPFRVMEQCHNNTRNLVLVWSLGLQKYQRQVCSKWTLQYHYTMQNTGVVTHTKKAGVSCYMYLDFALSFLHTNTIWLAVVLVKYLNGLI